MNKMPAQLRLANASADSITRRRFVALAAGTASLALAPISRARAQAAGVVKIGHIQPLTGPSAAYGIRARDGAIIAVDEINAAGGWTDAAGKKYQIEMSVGDMANDAKQAITLFRQYATDPQVIAVLGPTNSVGYVPLVPVAGQIKLPVVYMAVMGAGRSAGAQHSRPKSSGCTR